MGIAKPITLLGGLAGLGYVLWGSLERKRLEQPAYEVERLEGPVEIRTYEPAIVAVTEVMDEYNRALNTAFRRLAGYIHGRNHGRERIHMTSPFELELENTSRRIEMTSPVEAEPSRNGWRMTFLMPSRYGLNELPLPDDPAIRLERVPRRLMAALRFSGRTPEQRVKTKMEELLAYLSGTRWRATEAPRLAQYDPPFALPFLRRNEILVPVERVS